VFQSALDSAGVHPNEFSYLEAHGTGTSVGDPTEMKAVRMVYGNGDRMKPLIIGSNKANIGHCEAAAGMASLVKV
jgi:acyl transferase domain-containing protein